MTPVLINCSCGNLIDSREYEREDYYILKGAGEVTLSSEFITFIPQLVMWANSPKTMLYRTTCKCGIDFEWMDNHDGTITQYKSAITIVPIV